ncbi:MAG TPA: PD-(D/E)XK nuclease family protein [Jiangellaceae bacterium]
MSVTWTSYGAPAYAALRDRVSAIKRDDALAQVTVIVPTQLTGVAVRRALAHGVAGRAGVAGLAVVTLDRLAEQIAAPALVGSDRRPTVGPVLAAAWRRALTEDAGVFGPVAGHRSTVRALVEAHRELREVDDAGLDAITGGGEPIALDLVRLHRRVETILAEGWFDTTDLRRVATATLSSRRDAAGEIGALVVFLPQDLRPNAVRLLEALGRSRDVTVIAALTGDERADAGVHHAIASRTAEHAAPRQPVDAPIATRILHASDADDEVRCVVREVTTRLRDKAPAHRIAVLYGPAEPYARLLAEHLAAAGIATNGTGVRPTIERKLARVLLDLLELPDHDWRRDKVLALLVSAPILGHDGRRVPASRWDRISRTAGVVAGNDWDTRLTAYADTERAAAELERTDEAPRNGVIAHRERNAESAESLRVFVADLRAKLETGESLRTWPELAAWAGEMFQALLGEIAEEKWLPEDEARAAEKVRRIVAGLSGLGTIEATADLEALRLTLELELADDLPRQGKFGHGVLVAPLSAAIGLDADTVFVVGLAEDAVPGRISEDALLPDRVRDLTSGQLPPHRARVDRQHRHLLAAFAAAPERIASFPRGDLRRSSVRLPSRWLLPSFRTLSGRPTLNATTWESVTGEWMTGSLSYAASLSISQTLATGQEWRTRAAVAGQATGVRVDDVLAGDDVVRHAVTLARARAGDVLTRFDGDLSGHDVPHPTAPDQVISPTALEGWAICPHAFFVERLLRVHPLETPEELVQISPLEVGNLIHETLDRFFDEQSRAGAVPAGPQPWTAEQRQSLARIATQVADEFEARGLTGHRLMWRQERARILADVQALLDDDEKLRSGTGRQQVRSELAFGMRGADPVEVSLPDGRAIKFRGSADRVDVDAGGAIVVVDYKTGSSSRFQGLGEDDPTHGGTKLQLPVYAHAARAQLGAPDAPVSAEYWFLRKDRGKRIELPLTAEVHRAHGEALAVIAEGIAAGLFPHRPPKDDGYAGYIECEYCDPDRLGTNDHRARWSRKRHDPRLAAYLRLVEPDALEEATA